MKVTVALIVIIGALTLLPIVGSAVILLIRVAVLSLVIFWVIRVLRKVKAR